MTKQPIDGVLLFRVGIAIWLIVLPFLLPGSDRTHELSGVLSGAAMLVVAFQAERHPSLRYAQALIGIWVMCSAALLASAPIMIASLVTGHVLLFSAAISRELFTE